MKKLLVLAFLLLSATSAHSVTIQTGGELLNACQQTQAFLAAPSDDRTEQMETSSCIHFLTGFDSGHGLLVALEETDGVYCQPRSANIGDMVNQVVAHLETATDLHEAPAGIGAWKALASAWPCN